MNSRIINSEQTSDFRRCVLTYGHFSTIHPGHIRYLRHARNLGSQLVIALIGDSGVKDYPFKQKERAEALSLLGIADAVLLLNTYEIDKAVEDLQPQILVLGNEYKDQPEIQTVLKKQRAYGGKVQFHAGEINYATTDLLSGLENDLKQKRTQLFRDACRRQGLKKTELIKTIQEWSKTRLIVIGDTIVDQYTACEAIGMSAEAPVVVVKELEHKSFIGGAAVVAAHISALGANCDLISVVGNDDTGRLVKKGIKAQGIGDGITTDKSRPTTFKKRYLVENQKLFRVSRLEEKNLDHEVEQVVIDRLRLLAPKSQGIVISDFVYGVITPRILEEIQNQARTHNLMLFGDLQCSSQVGSITKFQNFSLLCPNEREARLALQDKDSGLEQISQKLLQCTHTERLVMKLGADGFIAYDRVQNDKIKSQPFPALCPNPLDVAGAGDSLFALFSTGLASGGEMMSCAALACCMAALAVNSMGNTPITSDALCQSLEDVLK